MTCESNQKMTVAYGIAMIHSFESHFYEVSTVSSELPGNDGLSMN